jgi:uncharacterized protein
MFINLSEVLSELHKPVDTVISIEMTEFHSPYGVCPILNKTDAHITVKHVKGRELMIEGECELTLEIPCDRCLEPVEIPFQLNFTKNVDLSDDVQADELDEKNYIDGYNLDVDKLLYNEILIGWPMKILCCEDCKGICNTCGQNLNKGTCNCEDTSLDPRMSVIRDVFKNFKEV